MKTLRLFALAIAASSTMLMSCEGSYNPNTIKANLESASYTVRSIDAASYTIPAGLDDLTKPEGLTTFLSAAKAPKDGMFAWFFDNIDHATSWLSSNQSKLFTKIEDNPMTPGQKNNLVYLATEAAVTAAKL